MTIFTRLSHTCYHLMKNALLRGLKKKLELFRQYFLYAKL